MLGFLLLSCSLRRLLAHLRLFSHYLRSINYRWPYEGIGFLLLIYCRARPSGL